jgi:hypothetical protein
MSDAPDLMAYGSGFLRDGRLAGHLGRSFFAQTRRYPSPPQ